MASDDVQALISQQAAAQMASADIAALIDQQTAAQIQTLIDQNMNSPEVQDQITLLWSRQAPVQPASAP